MTEKRGRKHSRIKMLKCSPSLENQGSAIVMVLVAIAFVSILGSMAMYATFYNYKMKVTDRMAKDSFYSAQLAMEEIRAGLKKEAAQIFSEAYRETLQQYGKKGEADSNAVLTEKYTQKLVRALKKDTDQEKYDIVHLQNFVSKRAENKDETGAFVDSSSGCQLLCYTDGVRLKDVRVIYTDENGYVSIVESDFLLAFPYLGIGDTYEFPQIEEYCLIADEKLVVEENGNASFEGSVYAGKEGMEIANAAKVSVQQPENGEEESQKTRVITDGNIILGNPSTKEKQTPYVTMGSKDKTIELWAKEIEIYGTQLQKKEESHLNLWADTYLQDDLTINSNGTGISLAGTYTGFGNVTTKAQNSSAIIINGTRTSLDFSGLQELSLGGNAYIATSKLNTDEDGQKEQKNEDIKMGNASATKIEQLAYLVPPECIGYDLVTGEKMVGKNPVNVKDTAYADFMQKLQENPSAYKEVNLNLMNDTVGKPLSNYGASYEKVFYKPDSETVWVYYYLKFNSTLEASRFFEDYYKASGEKIDTLLGNYIQTFQIGTLNAETMNIVGNMLLRNEEGETTLVSATIGEDNDRQMEMNRKYTRCSNQYLSLCKKLTENYNTLTSKERRAGVYENLINTELIAEYKQKNVFVKSEVVFENETAGTYALLILEGNKSPVDIEKVIEEAGLEADKVGLVVSERPIIISDGFQFQGTIISKGSVTISEKADLQITDRMSDVLTASYKTVIGEEKKIEALLLFRDGKSTEIADDENSEEGSITADDLVVYENWTKQ